VENAGPENVGQKLMGGNRGLENAGPNFAGLENAKPPSMKSEMDRSK